MIPMQWIDAIAETVVGCIAVVIIFLFYRSDVLRREKDWNMHVDLLHQVMKEHSDDLHRMIDEERKADREARNRYISVLTELSDLLKQLNGQVKAISEG
jgi:uncharacterized membrane protein YccC